MLALGCGLYFSVANSDRGWLVPAPNSLFATPDAEEADYDLQALNILNRALLQIKDNYVDPERVDAERMLAYALDAIQEEIPQVVARFDAALEDGPTSVNLQVGRAEQTFELGEVGSLWEMSFRLREIFRFVQESLEPGEIDFRRVEYAAINGMLDTLDPHSVLLSPEIFAEMQANNEGSFGGLGIVISIRDGQLTIISPIDNTPAHRAGLNAGDRIVKIGEESTINMTIEEAVRRLRGDPGTSVDIEVMREGWSVPHLYSITREVIHIESVVSEVLDDNIGYVRVSNFQANTHDDLLEHLQQLRDEMGGLNGLVLDLRDNPGGLLDQAIRISDTFLDDGTIVTTVGEGHRLREEKKATEEGTEPFYPIVVLVNPGSASASEIVAGALQNHGRAVLVGERTFGKGSVQVLYEFQDGSALKLTIAQYLTPGDISIQSVGVVPDIRLVPMQVADDFVDLYPSSRVVREADLDAHLDSELVAPERTPDDVIRFFLPTPEETDEAPPIGEAEFEADFEIEFAQRLLVATGETWEVEALIAATSDERGEIKEEQISLVSAQLEALGIDWSAGESAEAVSSLTVTTSSNFDGFAVPAGETLQLTVAVTNDGAETYHRLRALSDSEYDLFDDREFIFGRLGPGETAQWTVPIEIQKDEPTRLDQMSLVLYTDTTELELEEVVDVVVDGRERPHFGFAYRVIDDEMGNGDGLLQVNEDVVFRLYVYNLGPGDADETLVYIKNEVETAILLEHGRETIEEGIPAATSHVVDFQFEVRHAPEDGIIRLEAAVFDTIFREFTSRTLELTVHPDGDLFSASPGLVQFAADTPVLAAAHGEAVVLTTADEGSLLTQLGVLGDWTRVAWADDEHGWVPTSGLSTAPAESIAGLLTGEVVFQPPVVQLDESNLSVDSDHFTLSGQVSDDDGVVDYVVWVSGREDERHRRIKVAYTAVSDSNSIAFSEDVPLFEGANRIAIIARDSDEMSSTEVVYVYRRSTSDAVSTAEQVTP